MAMAMVETIITMMVIVHTCLQNGKKEESKARNIIFKKARTMWSAHPVTHPLYLVSTDPMRGLSSLHR